MFNPRMSNDTLVVVTIRPSPAEQFLLKSPVRLGVSFGKKPYGLCSFFRFVQKRFRVSLFLGNFALFFPSTFTQEL